MDGEEMEQEQTAQDMDTEQLNEALFEKMSAAQKKYRAWLLSQSAEEILDHAYEYAMREDILISVQSDTLPPGQAKALLDLPDPLSDIYQDHQKTDPTYMEDIRQTIEYRAEREAEKQAQAKQYVYRESFEYAQEHGELEQFWASQRENAACKEAIENAIDRHYSGNFLDSSAAVQEAVQEYGYERVMVVLAVTIRHKEWDGRISNDNKAWARSVPVPGNNRNAEGRDGDLSCVADRCHPGLLNLFVDAARSYLPERCYGVMPSTGELIVIAKGESGCYETSFPTGSKEETRALAEAYNKELGVTKVQAAAMLAGSMFGWKVPAADPRRYGEDGHLLKPDRKVSGMER